MEKDEGGGRNPPTQVFAVCIYSDNSSDEVDAPITMDTEMQMRDTDKCAISE
jgi:hypothetical protein